MSARTRERTIFDNYFDLVRRFPLVPIKSEAHLIEAEELIDRLLQSSLSRGGQDYLDVLASLVEDYEDKHHQIADATEAEVLQELMRANGLTQSKLEKLVGISQSTISDVLNGRRSLTREQIVNLARCFKVSPSVFLPVTNE